MSNTQLNAQIAKDISVRTQSIGKRVKELQETNAIPSVEELYGMKRTIGECRYLSLELSIKDAKKRLDNLMDALEQKIDQCIDLNNRTKAA